MNDVTGLADPDLAAAVAEAGVPVVLMHTRGTPADMACARGRTRDVAAEVAARARRRRSRAPTAAGIARERTILDPGIGFAKTAEQSVELLARVGELRALGRPLLVGPLAEELHRGASPAPRPATALPGTLAAVVACVLAGVELLRVHDVGGGPPGRRRRGRDPRSGEGRRSAVDCRRRRRCPCSTTCSAPTPPSPTSSSPSVDVAVVAYLVYRVLRIIRGTRAVAILFGLFLIGLAYLGAQAAGLETLTWLLGHFLSYSFIFGVIVLFQADIRRALAELGRSSRLFAVLTRGGDRAAQAGAVDAVVKGAVQLARRRHGRADRARALRRSLRRGGLRAPAGRGALARSCSSRVFLPQGPIHDGAVVVQGARAVAAGCLLPLSVAAAPAELGTRHRAALGLAEEVDAAVVVVSEERGEILGRAGGRAPPRARREGAPGAAPRALRGARTARPEAGSPGRAAHPGGPAQAPGRRGFACGGLIPRAGASSPWPSRSGSSWWCAARSA